MADIVLKQNDRLPLLVAQLRNADGTPVNLSPVGTTVKFIMGLRGATAPKVNTAASVTNAVNGEVTYAWAATDTDVPASYLGEFEVLWPDGKRQTFPNGSHLSVDVIKDVG